jgi:hypothetical protein
MACYRDSFTFFTFTVVPTTEDALLAACFMLLSYLAYLFEDGSDMFSRNVG